MLAFIWQYLLNILPFMSEPPIQFTAEYSPWSGPVTWINIGNQELRVSVDLTISFTKMWKQETCPAFIEGGCYEPATQRMAEAESVTYMRDTVAFDHSGILRDTLFALTPVTEPSYGVRVRDRDVAGVLGAGKNSFFFANRIIKVSDFLESRLVRFEEIKRADDPDFQAAMFHVPNTSNEPALSWRFQGRFVADSQLTDPLYRFEIDLAIPDLLIPEIQSEKILEAMLEDGQEYQIESQGRILMKCNEISRIRILIRAESRIISLMIPIKHVPESTRKGKNGWCSTRIVISAETPYMVIGRLLMSSVNSLVLNFRDRKLGFVPRPPERVYPHKFLTGRIKLPVFSRVYSLSGSGSITFPRRKKLVENGVILSSESEVFAGNLDSGDRIMCFILERLETDESINDSTVDIPGRFDRIQFNLTRGTLRFILEGYDVTGTSGKHTGFIETTRNQISVCRVEKVNYELINPIPPELLSDGTHGLLHEECSVCQERYTIGAAVQELRECGHKFHQDCILPWVLGRDNTCPLCRAEINRREIFV